MLKVGLTGGIASGKSTVARIFRELGAHVLDADRIAREVVPPDSPALARIVRAFGQEMLRPDGTLDRAALGAIVFEDEGKRRVLEGILHPLILDEIDRRVEKLERDDPDSVVVVEAALILELGRQAEFDALVVVWADEEQQRRRLMKRDNLSAENADRRLGAQLPLAEKRRRAQFVVDNSGDPDACRKRRRARLRRTAAAGRRGETALKSERGGPDAAAPAPCSRRCSAGICAGSVAAPGAAPAAEPPGAPGAAAPAPLRVAQVLLFHGTTPAEIEANLSRLKDAGVGTVFVRVFQNRGDRPLFYGGHATDAVGVYFPSTAAPVVADNLAVVSAACRRLGLSVYAWMTTRACDWLLEERPELADLRYDSALGITLPTERLNLFHPVVRRRLAAVFRDLARADIDGVLFQDDLVLKAGEGFSPEAIEAYLEESGTAVSPGPSSTARPGAGAAAIFSPAFYRDAFWPWAAWKNRALLDLAQELMAAAREVRPGLRFALNLYYETVLNPRLALAWYAQDLGVARRRPFDYFSLMSYHRQIGRELSYSPDDAIAAVGVLSRQAAAAAGDPARVIVKVQALDWETQALIPAQEFDRALGAAAAGVSLAFVRGLDDPDLDVVRRHFLR